MSRTLKGTRARGLPPKVLLSQRQDATGSFPTAWRTSSDNRTGKYPVFFNDDKVIPFNQFEAADYDSKIPLGNAVYVEKEVNIGLVLAGTDSIINFDSPFVGVKPVVVISELKSSNNSHGVNVFLVAISPSNFTIQFSSEFNGSIVYRAAYDPSPGTLRVVERKPRYPNAFTRFTVKQTALIASNTVDITFNDFGDDTAENFVTFFDFTGNGQADIWPNITTQTRTLVALTASSIAAATVEFERFHGLHNRGIIYPLGMNQATILAGLSQENQIEMYGSVSFISGAVVNQPTKWIVASGSMKKNIADTFVTFTPGQDIQAFRDNSNPAVVGKISSSVNGINPFYATGSAVDVTGQGFQQPLWSKSKIEIDITPSATQTFTASLGYAASGSYPMGYWNPNTKLYEGIGTGKGTGNYAATLDGLKQHLEEQTLGFALSMDNGGIATGFAAGTYNLYGRQVSNYGFPYHPKFQPTGSQRISMSDYISEPFLLEKIVLETSGTLGKTTYSTTSAIWTFFLLNSRSQISGANSETQTVSYKIPPSAPSPPLIFVTSSLLTNASCDLIDHLQICMSANGDKNGYLRRELIVNSFGFSSTKQFILSSSVKTSLSYEEGFPAPYSGSSAGVGGGEYIQSLNYSGRNQLNRANGRDWRNTFEIPSIAGVGAYGIGGFVNSVNVNNNYTKPNPYLLLPTDKLTFGFQLPTGKFIGSGAGEQSTIIFSPQGINKITLYGSSLRVNPETNQLEEHHDTLNQLLSSESIHENLG